MTADLPPYSGPLAKCPKCLERDAGTEWHPDSYQLSPWGQIAHTAGMPSDGPGWLLRRCARCRYPWAEATEDVRVGA